jgi:hypothetical protein
VLKSSIHQSSRPARRPGGFAAGGGGADVAPTARVARWTDRAGTHLSTLGTPEIGFVAVFTIEVIAAQSISS